MATSGGLPSGRGQHNELNNNTTVNGGITVSGQAINFTGNIFYQSDVTIAATENDFRPWNVPKPPHPLFIGQKGILEYLSKAFADRTTQQCVVLTGCPGAGKSEICVQYAYQHREE